MTKFVDLDRCFYEIAEDDTVDPDIRAVVAKLTGRYMRWIDVLQHPRVIILGEAGMGKTTEFRLQRQRCRQKGTAAFFCRIEDLATYGLPTALDPASDKTNFDHWKDNEDPGVFFP
jgi:hypothetical protein